MRGSLTEWEDMQAVGVDITVPRRAARRRRGQHQGQGRLLGVPRGHGGNDEDYAV